MGRALIVDGSEAYRQSLAERLEALGLGVSQAGAGEELVYHRNSEFLLVVSDWAVPGLMGDELVRTLRPERQPVYIVSDSDVAELSQQAFGLGVKGIYHKLRRAELLRAIRTQLEQASQSKQPPLDENVAMPPSASTAIDPLFPQAPGAFAPTVLVVEDSPTIRSYLKRILELSQPGCQVLESEDGRSALSQLCTQKIHLIVTDLQMPGMDGESFLSLLQKNPVLCKKPVLVFSGAIHPSLRAQYAQNPVVALLPKPALPAQVAAAVRGLLQRNG